jgi:hypothetical protein
MFYTMKPGRKIYEIQLKNAFVKKQNKYQLL